MNLVKLSFLVVFMALVCGAVFGATDNRTLVTAARAQIGVTVRYVPSYQKLAYPNGDVPREQGVCVDVVIRAMRDAKRGDLQRLVHEDMKAHFDAFTYPLTGHYRLK